MDPTQLLPATGRAALVAVAATLVAHVVYPLLAPGRHRPLVLAAVLVPWLTPSLLTGYAWAGASVAMSRIAGAATLFYCLLLVLKFAPVAVFALHLIRAPVTREAVHCHRLLRSPRAGLFRHVVFLVRSGAIIPAAAACLLVFLFAFPEFELASLLSVPAWTVTIFDAHAGGLPVSHSLRLVLLPFAAQVVLILAAVVVAAGGRFVADENVAADRRISRPAAALAVAYLALAAAVVTLLPGCMVVRDVVSGISLLAHTFPLATEMATGIVVAALAAVLAVWWCMVFRRHPAISALGFCGLAGPLALSLAAAWLTTRVPLLFLRDTPAPLILVLALLALPVAFVAVRLADRGDRLAAIHAAKLLRPLPASRDIAWELRMRAPFWTTVLLFIWIYWDLTASSILAPVGVTPVSVRLYNLMHYGHTAALSGMLFLAILAPLAAAAVAYVAGRAIHTTWHRHG